ncbi:Imidazole glycerol phosphate synthase subunit HisF [Candidatus Gugararchaeum adminiculabundum]|nr:Imidazole glycerol phosphate synthase subunit HisF [Candidatus Gugararchaeum adminiculabundum]
MLVIPAVDILKGKVVRLSQGDYSRVETFSDDPAAMALKWVSEGAERVHVVDLDGAKAGKLVNLAAIKKIAEVCEIEVGGGIRSESDARKIVELGANAILGSGIVENPKLLDELEDVKENIIAGIDAKGGKVAVKGWTQSTALDAYEFARKIDGKVSAVIFTTIERDGMMKGPDVNAVKKMVDAVGVPVIASGGVTSISDLVALKKTGAFGAIIGKSLYKGEIDLGEAIEAAK